MIPSKAVGLVSLIESVLKSFRLASEEAEVAPVSDWLQISGSWRGRAGLQPRLLFAKSAASSAGAARQGWTPGGEVQ